MSAINPNRVLNPRSPRRQPRTYGPFPTIVTSLFLIAVALQRSGNLADGVVASKGSAHHLEGQRAVYRTNELLFRDCPWRLYASRCSRVLLHGEPQSKQPR